MSDVPVLRGVSNSSAVAKDEEDGAGNAHSCSSETIVPVVTYDVLCSGREGQSYQRNYPRGDLLFEA